MPLRIQNIILFALLSLPFLSMGQNKKDFPVTWEIELSDNEGEKQIQLIGDVRDEWYIYSMHTAEGGPIPAQLTIDENKSLSLIGAPDESATEIKENFDDIFEIDVTKLIGEVIFSQKFSSQDQDNPIIKGELFYQVCKDVCFNDSFVFAANTLTGETALGELAVNKLTGVEGTSNTNSNVAMFPDYPDQPLNDCANNATATQSGEGRGYWKIFLLGIFGGLIALLTPCVFPMIPLTVTFFTKRHENKARGIFQAALYGFSIFMIYFLLAVPFLIFKLPQDTLYRIATSPILNLSFFIIFVVFALSLFGFFELTLPSQWANKTDAKADQNSVIGIFFMAITLAIVSFSCTGPILGSLMAGTIASEGGQYKLVAGMSGFGVALGLPFALFAMFPGLLKKMPKSGSWMNTVKVVLAFVELGLAMKFLSNADLVNQWGLISYNTFLIIWILIVIAMAAYLFGFIRFPHDSKNQKISIVRKMIGVASIGFAIFLGTGLAGNSMGALSGFFPPKKHEAIHAFTDLDVGVAKAIEENKPILLDFTGWSCVNCRQVEQNIWPDTEVTQRLSEEVILISLYADESSKLPEDQTYFSENLGRTIKTVGQKWTDFEDKEFGQIAQPLYALVTADGKLLNSPIAFTNSVQDYVDFLDCGIETYKQLDKEKL